MTGMTHDGIVLQADEKKRIEIYCLVCRREVETLFTSTRLSLIPPIVEMHLVSEQHVQAQQQLLVKRLLPPSTM